jgi:hypothetical protein
MWSNALVVLCACVVLKQAVLIVDPTIQPGSNDSVVVMLHTVDADGEDTVIPLCVLRPKVCVPTELQPRNLALSYCSHDSSAALVAFLLRDCDLTAHFVT